MDMDRRQLVQDSNSLYTIDGEAGGSQSPGPPPPEAAQRILVLGFAVSRNLFCAFLVATGVIGLTVAIISIALYADYLDNLEISIYHGVLYATFMQIWVILVLFLFYKFVFDREMSLLPHNTMGFCVLVGFLLTLNAIMLGYASDPLRTPPVLQSIMFPVSVPFMMICSYVMLRKGLTLARLVCTGTLMVGLFICLEPQIWGMDRQQAENSGASMPSTAERLIWPLVYALSFIPYCVGTVLWEKAVRDDAVVAIRLYFWCSVYIFVWTAALFWTDVIPGVARIPHHTGHHLNPMQLFLKNFVRSLRCHFGVDNTCSYVIAPGWCFLIGSATVNVSTILLLRYADGAVYAAIVQTLVTPAGAIFWTLFKADPRLRWFPEFNMTTAFSLAGLAIMLPSVIMYTYFARKEEEHLLRTRQYMPVN